jgi:uncharacterized protein YkwD
MICAASLRVWRSGLLGLCLGACSGAYADALHAVQVLREGGCGGTLAAAQPVHHEVALDRAAELWSEGATAQVATERSGYAAESSFTIHVRGPDAALIDALRGSRCRNLADPALRDVGVYRRGADTWIVMAAPYLVPSRAETPALASRALQLVNAVRARGARCGARLFGAAPPVRLSDTLASVAFGHAADMANHDYFEHEDLAGRSPADRVRAAGYTEKLVGENIAYGPETADEVVAGWLSSPGHCENIMDPRFVEMGLAFAAGRKGKHGLYWVQLLADPKI